MKKIISKNTYKKDFLNPPNPLYLIIMEINKKTIFQTFTCIHCNGSGIIEEVGEKEGCEACGGNTHYEYDEENGKLKNIRISKVIPGSGKVNFLQEIEIDEEHFLEAGLYTDEDGKEFWGVEVNKIETIQENDDCFPFHTPGDKIVVHLYQFDTNSKDLVYAYKKSKEKLLKSFT